MGAAAGGAACLLVDLHHRADRLAYRPLATPAVTAYARRLSCSVLLLLSGCASPEVDPVPAIIARHQQTLQVLDDRANRLAHTGIVPTFDIDAACQRLGATCASVEQHAKAETELLWPSLDVPARLRCIRMAIDSEPERYAVLGYCAVVIVNERK
jgi:hypothetical protein